ncbi:unnamed protein product [Rhodiola kirilowii]
MENQISSVIGFGSKFFAIFVIILPASFIFLKGVEGNIGVNYGTLANDLPSPAQVARFLLESTIINRVRLFDLDSELIQAFAGTGIAVTITIPNEQIVNFTRESFAQQWVINNIQPYIPSTYVVRILMGNEVLSTANKSIIGSLVPAMQTLHAALTNSTLGRPIQVSTPHSLGILSESSPPSNGRFRQGYDAHVLKPLLSFLRDTKSPFMINPYPFFGCSESTVDYALFRPNSGVVDENTKLVYTNMLDGQLDATYSAMKLLGFADLEIVIAETGWPSQGDVGQVAVDVASAAEYNGKLMRHVSSGVGTPLMPRRTFETYIFALFNENLKPGPTCERNFGLFQPDMTPVYDIGILRPMARANLPPKGEPVTSRPNPNGGGSSKQWCIPKSEASDESLQSNIDYVCGLGLDCRPIQITGACFNPNTVRAHAAYAMNMYYQSMGRNLFDCDFRQTGLISTVDPSYGSCTY